MAIYEFDSEEEAIKALQAEGRKLKYIAIKVWRKYLSSYKPKAYIRTRKSQNAIKLGRVKQISEDSFGIEVTFLDDLAYHDSILNTKKKQHEQGHSIMLISEGWTSTNLERKIGRRERFTHYEGFDYIGKVKEEYEKVKHKGIELEIQWSGKFTRKSR